MIILWYYCDATAMLLRCYCDATVIILWYYCDTTGRADSAGRAGIRRMSGQFCQRRTAGRVDTSQPRVLRLSHLCVCVSLFLVLRLYICDNLFSDLYFSICSNRAIFAIEWTQASWDSGPSFFFFFSAWDRAENLLINHEASANFHSRWVDYRNSLCWVRWV